MLGSTPTGARAPDNPPAQPRSPAEAQPIKYPAQQITAVKSQITAPDSKRKQYLEAEQDSKQKKYFSYKKITIYKITATATAEAQPEPEPEPELPLPASVKKNN